MLFHSPHPDIDFPKNTSVTHEIFSEETFMKNAKDFNITLDQYKNKPGLISTERNISISFQQMRELIVQTVQNLKDRGVKKGDIISVITKNCPEFPILFYAALLYGCILAPLNPLYIIPEILHHVEDSNSSYILSSEEFLEKSFGVLDALKKKGSKRKISVLCLGNLEKKSSVSLFQRPFSYNQSQVFNIVTDKTSANFPEISTKNFPLVLNFEKDFCLLVYSSGTTGLPKGVCLTHQSMVSNLKQIENLHDEPITQEVIISILPMFHVYGQLIIHRNLASGHTTVLQETFEPLSFLSNLQKYKITIAPIVPPILILMAKSPQINSKNLNFLKHIGCGAAPSGDEIINELLKKLPNVTISQGYGLSESSGVVSSSSRKWKINRKSSGQLLPNTVCKIVNIENGKLCKHNEKGEIWIKGPQIFDKYLNNEKATKETIDEEGFLHTGDIGYIDNDNYIFIVDRIKELIKFSGFQVAPAELEAVLLTHNEVADCAVFRAPDDKHGEIPAAIVVLKNPQSSITPEEIMEWFEKQVTYFKKIRKLEFVSVVPKSLSGKILRRELVEKAYSKSKL